MEIKKIENCNYVMFPRLQRPGLKPKHVDYDAFKAELKHVEGHGDYWLLYQQANPIWWYMFSYQRTRQSLTTYSDSVWERIIGAITLRATCLSSVLLRVSMLQNSLRNTLISSKKESMHSTMQYIGGMSMENRFFY